MLLLVLALSLGAATPTQQDLGAYTIRSFDTELVVEANSDLIVTERLEVVFSEPRRGIFRTIPVRYPDPKGYSYSLGFRLLDVTDGAGGRHQTQVTHEGRYVRIRIGDPDRTVTGAVTYVIRYRVRDALTTFAEHDEIYWNATGNEWNARIERATATVRLPAGVPDDQIKAAGYTGAFGATGRDVEVVHTEPSIVRFTATRPLDRLEGLTVAVGFPKGVVTFPSAADLAARRTADNWVLLLPFGWFAFLFVRYRRSGRDPDSNAPVAVMYEPPADLTPAGVGTLIDERVDMADITATVVDLAVRGYLTIRTEERDVLLGLFNRDETVFAKSVPKTPTPLADHEQIVLRGLFAGGSEVAASDLANKFYKHIPKIRASIYDGLTKDGYFDASPERVRAKWVVAGFGAALLTGVVALAWMGFRAIPPPAAVVIPIVTGVLTLAAFLGFAMAMPRRTVKGVQARQWALGFQEFAGRVEGDRLERAAANPRAAFEKLLPYAMALGVADDWARKFEGIYRDNGPSWYTGPHSTRGFSTLSMERGLTSAMSRASSSMTASPRSSSGSGGGGSSGGGGGGGGGGSW